MKILKNTVLKYIEKDDFVVPQRLSLVHLQ